MPQLDIYTFSTQIYFMAVVSFLFLIIFSYVLTYILFFESEVFERDELSLEQAKIVTKYELFILKLRYQYLAIRLADIFGLVLKFKS